MIKSRTIRWAVHVAHMKATRDAHRLLVGTPEGKQTLEKPRYRWRILLKLILSCRIEWCKLVLSGSG
jgi:hypothetical protein